LSCVRNTRDPHRTRHIRTRLTLWYVSLLTALLLLYCAGTTLLLFRNLHKKLAAHAVEDLEHLKVFCSSVQTDN
jgi:hypothetical protein